MRRMSVLLVMGMLQAGLLAILVSAEALDSTDNFTYFDTNRWS
jgi:hypothetical protein